MPHSNLPESGALHFYPSKPFVTDHALMDHGVEKAYDNFGFVMVQAKSFQEVWLQGNPWNRIVQINS